MLPVPVRCHPTADSCCQHTWPPNEGPWFLHSPATPKAERSPPKLPLHCQGLPQPLLSSWLPQGMEVSARTQEGLKTGGSMWQPPKAGLQTRKRNKTRAWCQQGNWCGGTRIWEYFAEFCSTRSTKLCHLALQNNTRGWGIGGHRWVLPEVVPTKKVQLIHNLKSTVHWTISWEHFSNTGCSLFSCLKPKRDGIYSITGCHYDFENKIALCNKINF